MDLFHDPETLTTGQATKGKTTTTSTTTTSQFFLVAWLLIVGQVGVLLLFLLFSQLSMISHNTTTIEAKIFKRFKRTLAGREQSSVQQQAHTWVYDLGVFPNFQAVLGDNVLLWLVPCAKVTNKGQQPHRLEEEELVIRSIVFSSSS